MALDGLDKHRMAPILSANVLDSCTKLVEDVMRVAHHSHCGCVDIKFAAARHVHAQCTRLSPFGTHRGNTLNPLDLDTNFIFSDSTLQLQVLNFMNPYAQQRSTLWRQKSTAPWKTIMMINYMCASHQLA